LIFAKAVSEATMPTHATADFRNLAMTGHSNCGKTSLVEAMLFKAGVTPRLGKVDDGSSIADYDPEEKERKITIMASILRLPWHEKAIQLIDTPGYMDFIGETIAAMNVAETILIAVAANSGIEVTTRKVWALAQAAELPCAIVMTKIDAEHSKFFDFLSALQKSFSSKCLPLSVPVGEGLDLKGVASVLAPPDDVPEELAERLGELRTQLIEAIVESDEALMERYLNEEEIGEAELRQALSQAIASRSVVPVFATSVEQDCGVEELLTGITESFPSPEQGRARAAVDPKSDEPVTRKPSPDEPFSALVFKTVTDPFVGKLSYFRVFSGKLTSSDPIYNATQEKKERNAGLLRPQGKEAESVDEVVAGEIAATAKLEELSVSDTLADPAQPIKFEPIVFPSSMVSVAVEPKSRGDEQKIGSALGKLADEDSTFSVQRNPETKEMVITGMSQLHLDVMLSQLKRRFNIEVETKDPKVPYLETVTGTGQGHYRHKKQTGGRGQYGEVYLRLDPGERGEGFEFLNEVVGGSIPNQFIPAVEKGVREIMGKGVIAGYPVVDLKCAVHDGSHHSVDSSEAAFKTAGARAFRDAMEKAGPVLLEPIVNIEITVPSRHMGDVTSDLNGRRGRVTDVESQGELQAIRAQVPLASIIRYSTELRSMTGGEGSYTMEMSHYDVVPHTVAAAVIAQAGKRQEDAE